MKHIRRLPAFLLCIALTATSSTALAAKGKAFTEKPTLKINLPSSMESYKSEEYTVTASLPGFSASSTPLTALYQGLSRSVRTTVQPGACICACST